MTLDEMYIECAQQADENIAKSGGEYIAANLTTVNKFKSGINYAYRKIATEKWMPTHSEDVTLDADLQFDVSSLTKKFNGIQKIADSYKNEIAWEVVDDILVECGDEAEGDTVTVYYFYIPDDLTGLTDEPVFPTRAVDHKVLCYFGTYYFFSVDNDTKADIWLNLFNDGFESISQTPGTVIKQHKGTW